MPHIHYEDEPRARAIVPHFVLEAVVEHEHLADLPLSVNTTILGIIKESIK